MATLIITEKTSQARDLAAALGSRYGKILPAEGHLLRLAEPDEIDPAWKRWCLLATRRISKPAAGFSTSTVDARTAAAGPNSCAA
jgi:DNA topoisomerase IA